MCSKPVYPVFFSDKQTNSWTWLVLPLKLRTVPDSTGESRWECAERETKEIQADDDELWSVYAVHRPRYQLLIVKPGKLYVEESLM